MEFSVYQSLKAAIQNLGQNFEIILWKSFFLIKLQAGSMKLLKTNFLALHFSVFFLDNANIFSLFLLIYPEVFLVLIFSSKNINFCVLNFVYLILRSFRKFAKFKSVCVWVCVCVCVYVYICINVTRQVIVATRKTQHHVVLFNMWQNFESS